MDLVTLQYVYDDIVDGSNLVSDDDVIYCTISDHVTEVRIGKKVESFTDDLQTETDLLYKDRGQ